MKRNKAAGDHHWMAGANALVAEARANLLGRRDSIEMLELGRRGALALVLRSPAARLCPGRVATSVQQNFLMGVRFLAAAVAQLEDAVVPCADAVAMNDNFICDVVRELKRAPLPAGELRQTSRRNKLLTQAFVPVLQPMIKARLGVAAKLKLYHGGDLAGWTKCKLAQNVEVGCRPNTFDIFVTDKHSTTLVIELEYAGEIDRHGYAIYGGAIQQGIGQALIGAMRYTYAVCLVVCAGNLPERSKQDRLDPLVDHLWQKTSDRGRVALIVRSASGSRRTRR